MAEKTAKRTSTKSKSTGKTAAKGAGAKSTRSKASPEAAVEEVQEKVKKTTAKAAGTTKTSGTKKAATAKKATAGKKTASAKKPAARAASVKEADGDKRKRSLIIVESPAKARTIEKFSKGQYIVKASMGHVRDLPKTSIGVNVDSGYEPKYITIRGKKNVIEELKKGVKGASQVFLASDPDREGEAIAWHLAHLLKVAEPLRIEMHEITTHAFNEALSNPREIDMNRVNAQQARRVLDRLVGYNLSPLLWRKISDGLSAGRVQSVAVKLICDRQKEIDAFIPEEYWSIIIQASQAEKKKAEPFEASLLKKENKKIEIHNKEEADAILAELKEQQFLVDDIKRKEQKKNPYPPYKTSTLQQEAHRRLGFGAKKTMTLAQQLYEGVDIGDEGTVGLITYMRTDSARVSQLAQAEADTFIKDEFGDEYRGGGRVYRSSKSAQEAHEAIRPTSVYRTPERMRKYLKRDQFRLYRIIWERFLTSQMASAILDNLSVDIKAGDYLFRATNSKVKFPGFLKVYETSGMKGEEGESNGEEGEQAPSKNNFPDLVTGDKLKVNKYLPKQHFTQPPPVFTEASLIKTLEEKGIGRPSTYAPIVDTIQKRNYVQLIEKKFRPTDLGYTVNEMLEQYFPNILDVDFTAALEEKLDQIEEGQEEWAKVIDAFYKPFSEVLADADRQIPKVEMEPEETGEMCDKCGKPLVIKRGRFGKFIACSGYPECRNTKPILNEIGVPCPEEGCGGQIIEKKSKKGKFYGCSNYPKCTFASWDKPTTSHCSRCGKIMVLRFSKQGKPYKACINPACKKEQKTEEE